MATATAPFDYSSASYSEPGTPGYTPDYNSLILADPAYLAYQATAKQTTADATAARQAALRALAIQYGGLPTGYTDPYGDIDPATLQQAAANPYSATAEDQYNYQQGVDAFKKQLAARGATDSGDLQYGLDQADYAKGQSDYTAAINFGQGAQNALNAYGTSMDNLSAQQIQAINAALQDVLNNPMYQPTAATPNYASAYISTPGGTVSPTAPAPNAGGGLPSGTIGSGGVTPFSSVAGQQALASIQAQNPGYFAGGVSPIGGTPFKAY